MLYIVKALGLASVVGRMESLKDVVDKAYVEEYGDGISPSRVDLAKYKCAACENVSATKIWGGCKASRYCSIGCQTQHWKAGGHNKECKIIRGLSDEAAEESSSGAAGSSQS